MTVFDWQEMVEWQPKIGGRPLNVDSYLEGLAGPGEQHEDPARGQGATCMNPKCRYEFGMQELSDAEWDGSLQCPICGTEQNYDPNGQTQTYNRADPSTQESGKGYAVNPGGTTRSGLTLTKMGEIGEQVVLRLGEVPGIGAIKPTGGGYNHPIDAILETERGTFGVEIKTNHSQAQERFKIGGKYERQQKILFCMENGLKPALVGVRLNFYTDKAYVFFREGLTDTWIGNGKMMHVGTFDFSDLNPFKSPDQQAQALAVDNANLPDQSLEVDVEQVFGKTAKEEPDYLFVYYMSELRVEKFEESLRHANMLEGLLEEFNVEIDVDFDDTLVAAGEIFDYGEDYKVDHKQLSVPEVRDEAENLIRDWHRDKSTVMGVDRDPETGQFVAGWFSADLV